MTKKNRNVDNTPTMSIEELKQLEQSESGELSPNELSLIEQMKAMQAQLEKLQSIQSSSSRQLAEAQVTIRKAKLNEDTYDLVIGTSNNATDLPGQGGLDIYVATSADHLHSQIRAKCNQFGRPIAFIPVVLYPQLVQDSKRPFQSLTTKDGEKIPNFKLGQTGVNQSYASHFVTDPDTGKQIEVSLTAFAVINANMSLADGDLTNPAKLRDSLDRRLERENKAHRDQNAHPEDNPETPAFIGYQLSQGIQNRLDMERPSTL